MKGGLNPDQNVQQCKGSSLLIFAFFVVQFNVPVNNISVIFSNVSKVDSVKERKSLDGIEKKKVNNIL